MCGKKKYFVVFRRYNKLTGETKIENMAVYESPIDVLVRLRKETEIDLENYRTGNSILTPVIVDWDVTLLWWKEITDEEYEAFENSVDKEIQTNFKK